jgi:hypothetical protein
MDVGDGQTKLLLGFCYISLQPPVIVSASSKDLMLVKAVT